ncbi:hypothetical protein Hbl1158_13860 [Halobaculum sp. CBA1158]|uniref:hypothetical protein n=1 Tax=Halobaculum sp. CBA1158 TaxID=2904243 RepID=UPI001F276A4E|nr:hypothetical protein [Halobaculum sp. CBA1158]UIO99594.1 hypothetical protein Hbl1158_13860 [Halobaculum sp. CBA1158]
MTDHITVTARPPLGTGGYAWWSASDAVAPSRAAFAAPTATANGTGDGVGTGYAASALVPSASVAA